MNASNLIQVLLSSHRTRVLNLLLVDIADGDLVAGLLLGQILYWFSPDSRGRPRVRIKRDGKWWLAKFRTDWQEEIRISPNQYDRASKLLKELGLVDIRLGHYQGKVCHHIRPIWDELERRVVENTSDFLPETSAIGSDEVTTEGPEDERELTPHTSVEDELDKGPSCSTDGCSWKNIAPNDPKGRCIYCFVIAAWTHYLPDKQKRAIKPTRTLRKMTDTRWKEPGFAEEFVLSIERASLSKHLREQGWFTLHHFLEVRNGEPIWQRVLDGFYDNWDRDKYPESYTRLKAFDREREME